MFRLSVESRPYPLNGSLIRELGSYIVQGGLTAAGGLGFMGGSREGPKDIRWHSLAITLSTCFSNISISLQALGIKPAPFALIFLLCLVPVPFELDLLDWDVAGKLKSLKAELILCSLISTYFTRLLYNAVSWTSLKALYSPRPQSCAISIEWLSSETWALFCNMSLGLLKFLYWERTSWRGAVTTYPSRIDLPNTSFSTFPDVRDALSNCNTCSNNNLVNEEFSCANSVWLLHKTLLGKKDCSCAN